MEKRYTIHRLLLAVFVLIACGLGACDPELEAIGEDPYAGGRDPLGIALASQAPSPASAYPGEEVTFVAKGVLAWANPEQDHYDFEFYIADEQAEIKTATDTTITVIVPQSVSSGITHILLQGQVFFGPNLSVLGNVSRDREWGLKTGTNGPIYNFLEHNTQSRSYYLLGGFSTVEGQDRSRIAYVSNRGVLTDMRSSMYYVRYPLRQFNVGGGIGGAGVIGGVETVSSMDYFDNGQMLLSGTFIQYESWTDAWSSRYTPVNNIVILNSNLTMDTEEVTVRAWGGSTNTTKTVSRFNGGTLQPILRSFVTSEGKVIAVGNILTYAQADYSQSTIIENIYNYVPVASVIRMERNGNLDNTYRAGDLTGGNNIRDAYMDGEDGVVVVGEFTEFDGVSANRIVRLGDNGTVDQSYMANIGSGANGAISMVRYNETLGKAVIVGNFTMFNGQPRQGIAVLNEDGSLDETFVPRTVAGGGINFGALLNTGKVVISGTFNRYDGVARPGFLILDDDGASTQRFNVPGAFVGQLYQVKETLTTTGRNGLLLMGNFSRFNGELVNNIVMAEIDFN